MQHLEAGRIGEATDMLMQLAGKFPGFAPGQSALGDVFSKHFNDFEKAEQYYKHAVEANGTSSGSYTGYAMLLIMTERYAEANAYLNKAANIQGIKKDTIHQLFGMLHEAQVQLDEAIDSYKRAILSTFTDFLLSSCEKAIARCEAKKKYL